MRRLPLMKSCFIIVGHTSTRQDTDQEQVSELVSDVGDYTFILFIVPHGSVVSKMVIGNRLTTFSPSGSSVWPVYKQIKIKKVRVVKTIVPAIVINLYHSLSTQIG